jgi:signal transduction histidine kinase
MKKTSNPEFKKKTEGDFITEGSPLDKKLNSEIQKNQRGAYFIGLSITLITALHFATSTEYLVLHEVFQRLYYLPIIYAAYRYGLQGGIATSIGSAIVYIPHVYIHWHHYHIYALNQYAEMILFQVVAIVTGVLANSERKQRSRSDQTAAELQVAYSNLQKAVDQLVLAERMNTVGQLALALVHEVRNPLGAIRGATEALETTIPKSNTQYEFLHIIQTEVTRLNRLVSDFLDFGRPRPPEKLPALLNEVVQSVIFLVLQQASQQKVLIRTDLTENLPFILLDSEQIKQVLINLVLNGIDAMPDGGELSIQTRIVEKYLEVSVTDTGPGLADELKPKIFNPFLTTKDKGTGLGLAISHRLVTQNGGKIEVESTFGKGTTFRVQFPM